MRKSAVSERVSERVCDWGLLPHSLTSTIKKKCCTVSVINYNNTLYYTHMNSLL